MTGGPLPALEIAGIALALGFATILMFQGGATERRVQRRLQRLHEKRPHAAKDGAAQFQLRRREVYSAHAGLDRLLKRWMPNPAALHHRLARTGWNVTVARYLAGNLALLAVIAGAAAFLGLPLPAAILFGVAGGIDHEPHVADPLTLDVAGRLVGDVAGDVDA